MVLHGTSRGGADVCSFCGRRQGEVRKVIAGSHASICDQCIELCRAAALDEPDRRAAKVQVLDCTLRDGSYTIDFQYTAEDTARLCAALESAGFDLIEVGHGVGLHASESGWGVAAESDRSYLEAASSVLNRAAFGMFCIPGIARLEDVDMAADYGMRFIRIGTDIARVPESEPFIARAKHHGMQVFANFMKSYIATPREFAELGKLTEQFGTDILTIVDSAGGMMIQDVEDYMSAVREICNLPLAFHGHNNLGLGVGLSVRAVELGAIVVDGSLQGIGRSAGNAATELLVAALNRMGYDTGIDTLDAIEVGQKYARDLVATKGLDRLDIIFGYAQFHSSNMPTIERFAAQYGIDPARLIMRLCEIDKVKADPALVERLAREIKSGGIT